MVLTYFEIGKMIVEEEQNGNSEPTMAVNCYQDYLVVMRHFKTTRNRQKSCNDKKKNNIIFEFD